MIRKEKITKEEFREQYSLRVEFERFGVGVKVQYHHSNDLSSFFDPWKLKLDVGVLY